MNSSMDARVPPIPEALVVAANRTRELYGRAKADAHRVPLITTDANGNEVVAGFYTPHETVRGMRLGPLYVEPEYRRRGLARAAWERYRDRVCVAFVSDHNTASAALHASCGFERWRRGMKGWFWRRLPSAGAL